MVVESLMQTGFILGSVNMRSFYRREHQRWRHQLNGFVDGFRASAIRYFKIEGDSGCDAHSGKSLACQLKLLRASNFSLLAL